MSTDQNTLAVPVNPQAASLTVNDALPLGQMVKALAASELVPKAYQNNPGNVLIAIDVAQRIGASAFAVMQNLDVIHGRPSWSAKFLIATVNASRKFTPLRYRFEGERGTPEWGCRAWARDKAEDQTAGEECVGALVTLAMAKAEGWSTKSGSKWLTMPEQMLMYRAAAFWTRVYCPELSLGMTTEEVEDVADQVRQTTTVTPLQARVMELPAPAASPVVVQRAEESPAPVAATTAPAAAKPSREELTAKHTLPAAAKVEPAKVAATPAQADPATGLDADERTGIKRHTGDALEIRNLLDAGFPLEVFDDLVAANGGQQLAEVPLANRAIVLREMRDHLARVRA